MIICSTDRHRKPGEEHMPYSRFLDYVMATKPRYWIQLGDIDELVWFGFHAIYGDSISREELEKEREIAKTITVLRVPGNHDWDIYQYQEYIRPIEIVPQVFELEEIEFSHGHQYDPLTKHFWTPLAKNCLVAKILPRLYTRLFGTPGYIGLIDKQRYQWVVELYHEYYEKKVMTDGISRCFGHTHDPFVNGKPGRKWLGNAGAAEDGSWIEITEWGWRTRNVDDGL